MSFLKWLCAMHFHFPISLSLSFELFCQFYPSYISVYLEPSDVLLEEIVSHAAEVLADCLLRPHREPHLQEFCSWPLHNFLTHFIFILTQREFSLLNLVCFVFSLSISKYTLYYAHLHSWSLVFGYCISAGILHVCICLWMFVSCIFIGVFLLLLRALPTRPSNANPS